MNFGDAKKVPINIENIAKRYMHNSGLELLDDSSEKPDIVLEIEAKGKALHATYSSFGKQYSGTALSGTILFRTSNGFVYKEKFAGTVKPPGLITQSGSTPPYPTPSAAPWIKVFNMSNSFHDRFVEINYEFFGMNTLVLALHSNYHGLTDKVKEKILEINDPNIVVPLLTVLKTNQIGPWTENAVYILGEMKEPRAIDLLIASMKGEYSEKVNEYLDRIRSETKFEVYTLGLRREAARALGKINDPRAIEALISALQDLKVQYTASFSLKQITGENFGQNINKWQAYWEKNKSSFMK